MKEQRERYQRLFTQTWQSISKRARARIAREWNGNAPNLMLCDNMGSDLGQRGRKFGIYLNCGALDTAPDDVVRSVIAHEFGHEYSVCVQADISARNGIEFDERDYQHKYEEGGFLFVMEELAADTYAQRWGFSQRRIDQWLLQAGLATTGDAPRHA